MLLVLIDIVILTSFTVYEAIGHHNQFVKTPNKEQIERTTGVSFYLCKVGLFIYHFLVVTVGVRNVLFLMEQEHLLVHKRKQKRKM